MSTGSGAAMRWGLMLWLVGGVVTGVFGLGSGTPACLAQSTSAGDEGVTESMSESLGTLDGAAWYDPDAGAVRPVYVEPRLEDAANRQSRWIPKPERAKPRANPTTTTAPNAPNTGWTSLWANFPQLAGWTALALAIVGLSILLVFAFMRAEPGASEAASGGEGKRGLVPTKAEMEKLEHLPVEMQRGAIDLLERADRLSAEGRYGEAVVYLFGHRLLQLDRGHFIRLARGKTNWQYLRELSERPTLHEHLSATVELFELSYFGRHTVTGDQFMRLRESQGVFEQGLAVNQEAA